VPSRARNLSPHLHFRAGATPRSVKKASFARISLQALGAGTGKSRETFVPLCGALIIHLVSGDLVSGDLRQAV